MTRNQIKRKIQKNLKKIDAIKQENIELRRQEMLLSDNKQWFKEEIESHPKRKYAKKPNYLDGKLIGRIYWVEDFIDEDTGRIIEIKRTRIVRIDGEWVM